MTTQTRKSRRSNTSARLICKFVPCCHNCIVINKLWSMLKKHQSLLTTWSKTFSESSPIMYPGHTTTPNHACDHLSLAQTSSTTNDWASWAGQPSKSNPSSMNLSKESSQSKIHCLNPLAMSSTRLSTSVICETYWAIWTKATGYGVSTSATSCRSVLSLCKTYTTLLLLSMSCHERSSLRKYVLSV